MLSLKSVHSGIGKGRGRADLSHCAHFWADHPTVAILQMRRAAYPTVHTQGRGRADLSHCAHFWGWASHCGHFTNEKSCQSHCGHTRARKGWPITLCTLLRLSIPLWPLYKWEELPIPLCTHQPFLALVCAQWDRQLFSFVKWPQWDDQPQKCAQWDRSALPRPCVSTVGLAALLICKMATVGCSASKVCTVG